MSPCISITTVPVSTTQRLTAGRSCQRGQRFDSYELLNGVYVLAAGDQLAGVQHECGVIKYIGLPLAGLKQIDRQ